MSPMFEGPRKKKLLPADTKTTPVWVTETFFGIDVPKITQYEAISIRPSSITAMVRGRQVVVRAASSRKFWAEEEKMLEFVLKHLQGQAAKRQRAYEKLARLAGTLDLAMNGRGEQLPWEVLDIEVVPSTPLVPCKHPKL